jgi:hypothetical protein
MVKRCWTDLNGSVRQTAAANGCQMRDVADKSTGDAVMVADVVKGFEFSGLGTLTVIDMQGTNIESVGKGSG